MKISGLLGSVTGLASKAAGGWYLYAIIGAAAFGAGGIAAWKAQDVIYGKEVADLKTAIAKAETAHETDLKVVAIEAAGDLVRKMAEIERLRGVIAGIESTNFKEKQNALAENARLRGAVRDGLVRLRIAVNTASTGSSGGECLPGAAVCAGLGDGASVELSPEAGQAVLDLRAGMIDDDAKLRTCQAIAAQITAPRTVPKP